MTTPIVLSAFEHSEPDLTRLRLFPGRQLGEDEFDREQRYHEARLAHLLAGRAPGVIDGLTVRIPEPRAGQRAPDLAVLPGRARTGTGQSLELRHELRMLWSQLALAKLDDDSTTWLVADDARAGAKVAPDGAYVLVLERHRERVDPPVEEPLRRTTPDPLRDARLELELSLVAHPLPASALLPPIAAERRRFANAVTALLLPSSIQALETAGVALVLVMVRGGRVAWADTTALRREATAHGARWTLAAQVLQEIRALAEPPADPAARRAYFEREWKLSYLPAVGALPATALLQPASASPRCAFFPDAIAVELSVLPASQVSTLLEREIGRAPLALRQRTGDRVRVLLAVPDARFRADLMDLPAADPGTLDRLHRAFAKVQAAWAAHENARLALRGAPGHRGLRPYGWTVDRNISLTPAQMLELAAAARSGDDGRRPTTSDDFVLATLARERAETTEESGADAPLPAPYRDFEVAGSLARFASWRAQARPPLPANEAAAIDAPPADPTAVGVTIEQAFVRAYIEALRLDLDEAQERLQLLRDHALEQRQQLDAHTVNLATLAGGVAADGNGLSLARWLPNINLGARAVPFTPSSPKAVMAAAAKPFELGTANPDARVHATIEPFLGAGQPLGGTFVNTKREDAFGVMRHIRPDVYEADQSLQAYSELYTRTMQITVRSEALKWKRISDALDRASGAAPDSGRDVDDEEVTFRTAFAADLASRTASGAGRLEQSSFKQKLHPEIAMKDALGSRVHKKSTYRWLVAVGQRQVKLVGHAEALGRKWERVCSAIAARIEVMTLQLAKLERLVSAQRVRLVAADRALREAESDYDMAKLLASEDWTRTEALDEERTRLLNAPLGVYYVRVRQTVDAIPLSSPASLRFTQRGDLVPGLPAGAPRDLSDELDPFLDALLDAPLGDFAVMHALKGWLPSKPRLQQLADHRLARVGSVAMASAFTPASGSKPLSGVLQQTLLLRGTMASVQLQLTDSGVDNQKRVLAAVSVADALAGPAGALRNASESLRRRLEQATVALLDTLNPLGTTQRYDWAQAAEDDLLAVFEPDRWPGFASAAPNDAPIDPLRTLLELVSWLRGQLAPSASAAGVNALRNLLRAVIIHAAHGDAGRAARGRVLTVPTLLAPGASMRVELDRAVAIGERLHLLSPNGLIAGSVRVDEHDALGTVVRLTELRSKVPVTTAFRLASQRS